LEVFKDKRYLYVTVHHLINGQYFVFHIFYKIRQSINSKVNEMRRKTLFAKMQHPEMIVSGRLKNKSNTL